MARGPDLPGPMFPGPYGFFLSGYMLGLIALAILLHRIQNIVVPPSSSSTPHQAPSRLVRRFHNNTVRRLYESLLPLDLTRTGTRLAFHLPTLYFLCKMLLVWTVILLQTSDLFPAWQSGYIYSLGQWTQHMEMHAVCWRTFCSICVAFSMEAFVRGLDGGGLGLMQMNANTAPFNLIGYAFLLHIYSSPITHVYKPASLPSRPDKHVIVTIAIPLLQLTIFHILSIRKRWSNHRFLPTALSSLLSLLHFHMTLYAHYSARPVPRPPLLPKIEPTPELELFAPPTPILTGNFHAPTPPPPPRVTSPPGSPLYSRPTGSTALPLLNYVPNAFETLLLLTIALTVGLNVCTQLILTGRVSRPLLGLGLSGSGTNGGWAWAPPYEEDWGVVLLRVGTASLEATGLRGWGNELPAVTAPPLLAQRQGWNDPRYPEYGTARLGPSGVMHVSSGFGAGAVGKGRRRRRGLANEVREVDVGAGAGSRAFGEALVNLRWIREAWRFVFLAWVIVRNLVSAGWGFVVSGRKSWRGRRRVEVDDRDVVDEPEEEEMEMEERDAVYTRFLRQEEISDDEDDPAHEWDLGDSSDSEDEPAQEEEFTQAETVGLYTDLAGSTSTSVMLAHMSNDGETPMTRRRYGSLVDAGPPIAEPPLISLPLRAAPTEPLDEARRNCVICTCDPREIICWPCRCLSMCNGCREVLASRSSASKHRCPCCRQPVEGFSRIFIP
ncbi:hypothetical protein C8R46DRAFT_1102931 [Mycena filopes]|nr:hypothetical protein C8R46DRAFT_1102931 [Mycena filopes]